MMASLDRIEVDEASVETIAMVAYRQARAMVEEAAAESASIREEVRDLREKSLLSLADSLKVLRQKAEADAAYILANAELEATAIRFAAEQEARDIRQAAMREETAQRQVELNETVRLDDYRPDRGSWLGAPVRFLIGA